MFSDQIDHSLCGAAAVEVFHNFTLLHDDIMDNAPVRHGRDAVHKAWSKNAAILSGDAMMIYSYSLLEKLPEKYTLQILKEFNTMAMEVCQGQQLDMEFETREKVALGEYIEMVKLKTSALLARSLKMGAILGGASSEDASLLYDFCIELGVAFQIQDDLLDTFGDPATFGKPIGGDIIEAKKTFTSIEAIRLCSSLESNIMLNLLHNKQISSQDKIKAVTELYTQLEVKSYTEKVIADHINSAIATLERTSVDEQHKQPLRELAQKLLNRNK